MKRKRLKVTYQKLEEIVLPLLIGQVFHVTNTKAFSNMLLDKAIKPNQNGAFPFSHTQSENSFFRKRGCVSVCDLRYLSSDRISEGLIKYNFLDPYLDNKPHLYLFLKSDCLDKLISWQQWHKENAEKEMLVPYIEAGYPEGIELNLIKSVLFIEIKDRPKY